MLHLEVAKEREMSAPRYVIRKVGDKYVSERQPDTDGERVIWGLGGAVVGAVGLVRGGPVGAVLALGGAGMIFYAATGRNLLMEIFCPGCGKAREGDPKDAPSFQHDWKKSGQLPADVVDEVAMESFPASDAPGTSVART
jgi:hypothetical protein